MGEVGRNRRSMLVGWLVVEERGWSREVWRGLTIRG
jgi:hypothetical protein